MEYWARVEDYCTSSSWSIKSWWMTIVPELCGTLASNIIFLYFSWMEYWARVENHCTSDSWNIGLRRKVIELQVLEIELWRKYHCTASGRNIELWMRDHCTWHPSTFNFQSNLHCSRNYGKFNRSSQRSHCTSSLQNVQVGTLTGFPALWVRWGIRRICNIREGQTRPIKIFLTWLENSAWHSSGESACLCGFQQLTL